MDGSTGHTYALGSQVIGHTPGGFTWAASPQANGVLCMRCAVRESCIGSVAAHAGTRQLVAVLAGRRELHAGEVVHEQGDAFGTLSVLRRGALQSSAAGDDGQRVRGFYFPGELVGVGALADGRHTETSVALEATELCAVRFHASAMAPARPYEGRLWDMMSRDLLRARAEAGQLASLAPEQRVRSWLTSTISRLHPHGAPADEVHLPISADSAGNYLGLGPESIAEALSALAARGLLELEGEGIRILQPERFARGAGS